MARIKPEFDRRGVKIIGLSVDPIDRHAGWVKDIEEPRASRRHYPMIATSTSMSPSSTACSPRPSRETRPSGPRRQPDRAQCLRHRAGQEGEAVLVYPMTTGRNFDDGAARHRRAAAHARHRWRTPVNWKTARTSSIAGSVSTTTPKKAISGRLEGAQALHPHRPQPRG